ncbi:WYL domain-containing protein [Streptomyces sp. DSM 42041]|uniref:WYL domain-containing protein n=1 Tax=Streptomyces hazeniae TaxID=3075538 RepID=A0ABU2NM13_9ACTN|nr:WYL domain-containing protein [Streptomyces sp. DSM 42041]MDT0377273.1 WYL domain-containing protein [Streptomyces sp. DSM 42041]
MKITGRQTTTATLTDLYRAIDAGHPITMAFLKEERDQETGRKTGRLVETIRTVELYDLRTTHQGDIIARAMDRETGEARTIRLDRILNYTIHRTAYTVPHLDSDGLPVAHAPEVFYTAQQLIAREFAREDRAYLLDKYGLAA